MLKDTLLKYFAKYFVKYITPKLYNDKSNWLNLSVTGCDCHVVKDSRVSYTERNLNSFRSAFFLASSRRFSGLNKKN